MMSMRVQYSTELLKWHAKQHAWRDRSGGTAAAGELLKRVPSVVGPGRRRLVGDDGDLALVEQAVELAGAALVAPVVQLPQVPREEAEAHTVRDIPQHARRPPPRLRLRHHLVRRRRHGRRGGPPRQQPARTGRVRLQGVRGQDEGRAAQCQNTHAVTVMQVGADPITRYEVEDGMGERRGVSDGASCDLCETVLELLLHSVARRRSWSKKATGDGMRRSAVSASTASAWRSRATRARAAASHGGGPARGWRLPRT